MNKIRYSIIIPNRGNLCLLKICIQNVLKTTSGLDHVEVIVIDNNPKQIVLESLKDLNDSARLMIYFCPKKGRSNARNLGVEKSNGEILIFLDSDSILEKNMLIRFLEIIDGQYPIYKIFQGKHVAMDVENDISDNDFILHEKNISSPKTMIPTLNTCFLAIEKKLLLLFGGFNVEFERFEDRLLGYNFFINSFIIYTCPGIIAKKISPKISLVESIKVKLSELRWQTLAESKLTWVGNFTQKTELLDSYFYKCIFLIFFIYRKFLKNSNNLYLKNYNTIKFNFRNKLFLLRNENAVFFMNSETDFCFLNLRDSKVTVVRHGLLRKKMHFFEFNSDDFESDKIIIYLIKEKLIELF